MKIRFEDIKEEIIPNFRGGEKETIAKMFVDDNNRIMHGKLVPGASIGMHTHDTSSEIIYFLSGSGKTVTDGVEERYTVGECHYCPKGSTHTLINDSDEDLIFFAVIPQH